MRYLECFLAMKNTYFHVTDNHLSRTKPSPNESVQGSRYRRCYNLCFWGFFFFSWKTRQSDTHHCFSYTHTHTHKNEAKYLTNMRKSSVHFPASSNFTSPNHEWMLDWLRCAVCEKSVTAGLRHMNGIQSH